MARLGRRVQSLESRISPDRPKLIFIMPYVDPSESVSGLTATLQGKAYTFAGSNMDELLENAQSLLEPSVTSQCELVSVSISTQ